MKRIFQEIFEPLDKVLCRDEGKIIVSGSHKNLLTRDGQYADFYRRPFYVPPYTALV